MNLCDRRAKATVQYMIPKGIAKDRISGKGSGRAGRKYNVTNVQTRNMLKTDVLSS
ncbi:MULTISPECIES: hypothetical protein [Flavobacterium]|uniref:hypothetical protein n=1 Tax=Flavobacterium TaxID=237 RepID=UPI001FCAC934|nr:MULTISPECIES: hypothetical protein [Flavobacterium]UOK43090.1 hypothetical protein LZF87_02970 [Flavobacterium enshiense]